MRRSFLVLLLLAGCAVPSEPPDPIADESLPFTPPATYNVWWAELLKCSGLVGDFEAIAWYEFAEPFRETVYGDEYIVYGFWKPPHNIYLYAQAKDWPNIVKGEMLHELLRGDGQHEHEAWQICGLHAE